MKRFIVYIGVVTYGLAIGFLLGNKCYGDFIPLRGEVVCIDCDLRSENVATQFWGVAEKGFQSSLYVSNVVYSVGKPISVFIRLRNTLDHPIPFSLPSTLVVFALSATDPEGRPAALTDYGERQTHGTVTSFLSEGLSAQGILKMRYPLDQLFHMAKPGKYIITARFRVSAPNPTNEVFATSNTVTVEVVTATSPSQ